MKAQLIHISNYVSELNFFQKNVLSSIIDIIEGIDKNSIKNENSYVDFSKEILTISITSVSNTENYLLISLQPELIELYISRFMYVFIDGDDFKDKLLIKKILVEFLNGNYLIRETYIGKNLTSTEILWENLESLNKHSNSNSIKTIFSKMSNMDPEIKDYMGQKISFKVY